MATVDTKHGVVHAASHAGSSNGAPAPHATLTIGQYLIKRLQDYGLKDLFGIPGDYVLDFYTQLTNSPINVVTCTREDCAGFAADAYARTTGFGAVCVTYCVGGLSCCNSIAGAFAEKSPVLLISGSPGLREQFNNHLLHHRVGEFQTQFEIYRRLTVAAAAIDDPNTAFREIDRVIEAVVRRKGPGYLELPRDLVNVVPEHPYTPVVKPVVSDPDSLCEAVSDASRLLSQSIRPVIIAGVELHRFGQQEAFLRLVEEAGLPFVTTALGKSVVSELHPLYAGLYEGKMGRQEVADFVEESDCVMLLGEFMTDIDSGVFTANLDPRRCIHVTSESLQISHHHYQNVLLGDFIERLTRAGIRAPKRNLPPRPRKPGQFETKPDAPVTIARLVARLNESLDENSVVVADVGDSLFASMDLTIHKQTKFISPAYYTSMGFAVPAALGVQTAARNLRPIVLVGDGAFQMTGMELSTIVRHAYNPVIVLLDNKGYGTERFLHDGEFAFNNIHPWKYHKLPDVLGGGTGYEVRSEGEFDAALKKALADPQFSLIQVHLDVNDASIALRRLAERLIPKLNDGKSGDGKANDAPATLDPKTPSP
ncbi:MAG TPA: thiamine pyrophosphate-dependent enzyme [Pirellulales bacterium]